MRSFATSSTPRAVALRIKRLAKGTGIQPVPFYCVVSAPDWANGGFSPWRVPLLYFESCACPARALLALRLNSCLPRYLKFLAALHITLGMPARIRAPPTGAFLLPARRAPYPIPMPFAEPICALFPSQGSMGTSSRKIGRQLRSSGGLSSTSHTTEYSSPQSVKWAIKQKS